MNAKIQPMAGFVLLGTIEAEDKTDSGLYKPDSAKEELPQGKVLAIGDKGEQLDLSYCNFVEANIARTAFAIKVGDIVIYQKYGDQDFKEFKLVSFEKIIGRIE